MSVDAYLSAFEATWSEDADLSLVRFVALDTETTGLDPRRDSIITIGAVGIVGGQIQLEDTFEVMLPVRYNKSSVTVHGITRDEAAAGTDEPEALLEFLGYLRDGVIVGHHIGHDIEALNHACERHFGMRLQNRSLDTMDLTLRCDEAGAFEGRPKAEGFSLDALCGMFGIPAHDRHTAGGDAFLTAQVFLRLLRAAKAAGFVRLETLCEPYRAE